MLPMNGYVFALIFVPLMAFMVVVLPMWVVLYYRDRNRQTHTLSSDEWRELQRMFESTERLEARLAALESILDNEHKGWRNNP
jgi:phage shock protein B